MPTDPIRDALMRQLEEVRSKEKSLTDALDAYDRAHNTSGPRSHRWKGYVPWKAIAEFLAECEQPCTYRELRDALFEGGLMADNKWKDRDFKRTVELNLGLAKFTINGRVEDRRNDKKKLVRVTDDDVIGLP